MTRGTSTSAEQIGSEPGEVLVRSEVTSASRAPAYPLSSTPTAHRVLGRITSYVLPAVAAAAAFGGPAEWRRRRFSMTQASRSEMIDVMWTIDEVVYTEEYASIEQIRALNALLDLPAATSFSVELED
jgi:hypothetical protein